MAVAAPIQVATVGQLIPAVLAHRLAAAGSGARDRCPRPRPVSCGRDGRAPARTCVTSMSSSVTTASMASNDIDGREHRRAGGRWCARRDRAVLRSSRATPRRSGVAAVPSAHRLCSTPNRSARRASICAGPSTYACAAASSMASGRPSRRRHSEATATALRSLIVERRLDGDRPVGEQPHGVDGGDACRLALVRARGGQRRQRHDDLTGDAEWFPARRQHPQVPCRGEQADGRGGRHRRSRARSCRGRSRRAPTRSGRGCAASTLGPGHLAHADRLGDRRCHRARPGGRREIDEPHAVREALLHVVGHLDRQAGLAHAAGTGDRDERTVVEPLGDDGAARRRARRSWSASAAADGEPADLPAAPGAGPDHEGRPAVSAASPATIARSRSRSSSPGSRPSCSPSSVRARWKARSASAWRPSRWSASISCAQRCWRSGSATVAASRSAISAASPPASKRASLRSSTIVRKSSSRRVPAARAGPSARSGAGAPRHSRRAAVSASMASSASPSSSARRPSTTRCSNSWASTRSATRR